MKQLKFGRGYKEVRERRVFRIPVVENMSSDEMLVFMRQVTDGFRNPLVPIHRNYYLPLLNGERNVGVELLEGNYRSFWDESERLDLMYKKTTTWQTFVLYVGDWISTFIKFTKKIFVPFSR